MILKKIILDGSDGETAVLVPEKVKAKSFTGVERKLKGRDIIAILKTDHNEYLVFLEE